MNLRRAGYRLRQVWLALWGRPSPERLIAAEKWLAARQMALFRRMQPGEQAHSLDVLERLIQQGEDDPHLLAAALLHDVGKARAPLRVWERVLIVLAKKLAPRRVHTWGSGKPQGWRRPFVVAAQHPAWGAEMAREAGVSPQAAELIRGHQEPLDPQSPLYRQMSRLQTADDES